MDYKTQINKETLPQHIAIIMDGNGRWALQQNKDRLEGHYKGVQVVRNIVETAGELGIKYLTLYVFSMENWSRPSTEVNALMSLLVKTLEKEIEMLQKNNVRLRLIGNLERLPSAVKEQMQAGEAQTSQNDGLQLVLALSYSAREEIVQAAKTIAQQVQDGKMEIKNIDESRFASALATKDIPDPDLLIRTSGELRISNFLLWQIAYSELYFTECLWPDFSSEEFYKSIINYQRRERRFGKISKQL